MSAPNIFEAAEHNEELGEEEDEILKRLNAVMKKHDVGTARFGFSDDEDGEWLTVLALRGHQGTVEHVMQHIEEFLTLFVQKTQTPREQA